MGNCCNAEQEGHNEVQRVETAKRPEVGIAQENKDVQKHSIRLAPDAADDGTDMSSGLVVGNTKKLPDLNLNVKNLLAIISEHPKAKELESQMASTTPEGILE